MGALLTHISEYRISELTRTVHAVSESKIKIKQSLENTVVCHFGHVRKRSFLGQEFT